VGVLKPDLGEIIVKGQNVPDLDENALAAIRRICGMVFQHPALLDSLTIGENVAFGLRTPQFILSQSQPWSEAQIQARILEVLRLVHLDDSILDLYPPEISYGMQKRVSLARTLAPSPEVLLFDEPTTGLDPITTGAVNSLILELSRKLNVTSIVVSHDMACALQAADRILVLDGGNILAIGPTSEIRRSEIPLIKDFLSETLALLPPEERK
jgi:phospholipid/cholesterol/gamma-HCH transport system ATP-binding protein